MKRLSMVILLLVCCGLWAVGCTVPKIAITVPTDQATAGATSGAKTTAVATSNAKATAAPTAVATTGSSVWQADGVINAGEYAHKSTFGPLIVYWSNDDTYLYLAMEARTKGWLSVGLDYDHGMAGANYLIGAIINGKVVVEDNYGTLQGRNSHNSDTDLGGTNDIIASGGSYTGSVTRLEVQIPLDSGDQYDKPLTRGQTVQVILGVGSSNDLTSMHTFASYGQIKLD